MQPETNLQLYSDNIPIRQKTKWPIFKVSSKQREIFFQSSNPFIYTDQLLNYSKKLRIMTYNVQEWKNFSTQVYIISRIRPDILSVQEGVNFLKTTPLINNYKKMGELEELSNFYQVIRCFADNKLLNYIYLNQRISYKVIFSGKIGGDNRCAIVLECQLDTYRFIIVNVHLSVEINHQISNLNYLLDKVLLDKIKSESLDIYLTGDLNSYSRPINKKHFNLLLEKKGAYFNKKDEELERILFYSTDKLHREGFVDTYDIYAAQHNVSPFKPINTTIYGGKIDHILVNSKTNKTILGCYQIMDNNSDHTPLVVDISIDL